MTKTQSKDRNRKRILRKKILYGFIAFFATIVIGGIIFVHTKTFESILLKKASQYLETQYHLTAAVESLDLSPFRLSLVLNGIEIQSIPGKEAPLQHFKARKLEIDLAASTLITNKIHIQKIHIIAPDLALSPIPKRADSDTSASTLTKDPISLRIDELQISDGSVSLSDGEVPISAKLEAIEIGGNYQKNKDLHTGFISSENGQLQYRDSRIFLQEFHTEFDFDGESLNINRLSLQTDPLSLSASGTATNILQAPQFDFEIKGILNLDRVKDIFPIEPELNGNLSFSATVEGSEKDISLKGNIEGQDAIVADVFFPVIRASFNSDTKNITLDNLELVSEKGWFQGKLDMDLLERRESTAEIEWDNVDLSNFEKLEPRLLPYLSSVSSGRISAKWQTLDAESIQAQAELKFTPSPLPHPFAADRNALSGNIRLETSDGLLTIMPSSLDLNQTKLSLSGTVDSAKNFDTKFGIEIKDLSEVERFYAQLAAADIVPELLMDSPLPSTGQISIKGKARGTTTAPEMTLSMLCRDMSLGVLEIRNMNGRFTYDDTGFGIPGLGLQFAQGLIQAQGKLPYNLADNSFGDNADLTITAEQVDLAPIASLFQLKYSMKGIFSGNVDFSGSPETPRLRFSATAENLSIEEHGISFAELRGQLIDRQIGLDNIVIRKGKGILEGNCGIDLVSKEYFADLAGRDIDLSDFNTTAAQNASLSGIVRFQFKGKGTLDKPIFSLQATAEKMAAASAYLERVEVNADSDGNIVTLQAKTQEGQTSLEAQLPMQEPLTLTGRIKTRAFNAWNILRHPGEPLPSPVSSEITAAADFSIPLQDWKQSTARIDFEKLAFRYTDHLFQNNQPFSLRLDAHHIELEPVQIMGPETELTLSGRIPLRDVSSDQIVMNGTVNLRILEAFLTNTEIAGSLRLSGSVSGTVIHPIVNARIELEESFLATSAIPYTLHDLQLRAGITNNVVDLEELGVGIDQGRISAKGRILLPFPIKTGSPQEIKPSESAQNDIIVTLSALDLGRLVDLLPEKPPADLGGSIDGIIRLRGDLFADDRVELEGELSTFEINLSKFKMKNDDRIRFHFKEKVFHLNEFRLSGKDSFIQTGLTLRLEGTPLLDGHFSADLNTSILTPFFEGIILDGLLSLDLEYKGSLDDIGLNGKGTLSNGLLQMQDIPFLATEIGGDLRMTYGAPATFELSGLFNGGKATARGKIEFAENQLTSAEFGLNAEQVQISYPEGFQGLAEARLSLNKREKRWQLSGEMGFTQSYFNGDIYPGSELVKNMRSKQRALKSDIPEMVRELDLAIDVATITPLIIDNNLASLELDSAVRIGGTVYDPRLSGYIRNREPGEIIFGNRSYEVEQASIDYTSADPLEGQVNVIAHTQMRHGYDNLDVTMTASGPITKLNFSLSSSPPRSQLELASLLITGYGTERLKDEAANVLGNQLMLYFMSPLASPFTNRLKTFLGAEDVRIEPINIATEEDPGARFTFRKGLIHSLDLIYSIDISNTQNQAWILDYNLTRNFSLQSYAKDDGSYGGAISHRFFLGRPSQTKNTAASSHVKRYKTKEILFSGDLQLSKDLLEKATRKLKRGSIFYYRNLRSANDKLTALYKKSGYLNATISPSLDYVENGTVAITFHIAARNRAGIVFVGDPVKTSLQKKVINKWNGRLPEEMSMAEVEKWIRLDLNSKGYIEAEVTASKTEEDSESLYVFFVHYGPNYRIGSFALAGDSVVSSESIKKTVKGIPRAKGKGLWPLLYDFKRSKLRIESLYEEMGFRNADIEYPEISLNKDTKTVDITLSVQQGVQSIVHSVDITGNKIFSISELSAVLRLKASDVFSPINLAADTNMLYSFYRSRGYHDVNIDVQTLFDNSQTQAGVVYSIREGDILLISEIDISGNDRTPNHVIRRELVFKEGDPLNMEQIVASQKKLYDMLVFRTVNIRVSSSAEQKSRVLVEVQENPRFGVSYGARYSSEEKLEVFGQLDFINLLGKGRSGLLYYRQNDRQNDLRFSLKDPYIFGKRFNTLYSVSYFEETLSVFKSEEFGLTVQQSLPLPYKSTISYLFRLNRVHTYELDPIGPFPFDITIFLPEFQTFLVRDTRLNRLNANQGSFLSLSSRYSPSFLKTDLTYISFFGQYSVYLRLFPHLIWASSYRIGLADAFDQVLIPSRRFFAGGSNSIRGFEREMVGPIDPYLKRPIGGEALFIMNQELRLPVLSWLEGVAFLDVGNVYRYIDKFNPLDVRTGAGFGLRLNISAIFLRLDYGFNLSPREYEPRTVFYLSIGQAF